MADAEALELSAAERDFQQEFRSWLEANVNPSWIGDRPMLRLAGGDASRQIRAEWHRRMHRGGWIAIDWPKAYGGRGATLREKVIYNQELARVKAPEIAGWMGVEFVGRTLIDYGTPQQQAEFLPPILRADFPWAMGYSEPDAGTDLASLKTRAEIDGDDFVVNGVKLWNHSTADAWMFTLVRTDQAAPKHRGISYLLIDLSLPGVTIRPLASMVSDDGFTEVTFEDVRVPRRYLVGDLHDGWRVGMATLAYDRATPGATLGIESMLGQFMQTVARDARLHPLAPENRGRIAQRYVDLAVSRALDERNLQMTMAGLTPNAEGSQSKLFYSELEQRMAQDMMHVLGMHGLLWQESVASVDEGIWSLEFLWSKALTIAGGSSETLRTTLAQRMGGLPKP